MREPPGRPHVRKGAGTATKKEISRQLLKGVSRGEAASSLGCSKATVEKCAAKAREEGLDAERIEAMTDSEVSALFEDGRTKRAEGYLEPDYARICDRLARVPKMTLALQWARYCDCNPGGRRLYQYSQFCKRVGDCARTHDLAARIAHEPGRLILVCRAGVSLWFLSTLRPAVSGHADAGPRRGLRFPMLPSAEYSSAEKPLNIANWSRGYCA